MALRPAASARPLAALALAVSLLPFTLPAGPAAPCPASVPSPASGCCPSSAPPACPACPTEGRPSAPTAPKRAAACCSPAAVLPRASRLIEAEAPSARADGLVRVRSSRSTARAEADARRSSVVAASPPPRLLACTFRN
ncbi:MAG TPA: hypothetical protein PLP50_16365 [Thermoanaerobaculia bacterium]|nr:hypothetical protein [Thermoanaerobaculia bacterium]HPA53167.1 hypothetical protein [Thermoanaerobaculia bacterium]HQN07846.1 hypothetical protein [Thermoanaerobaculia bacterium]HQP86647.1 hypothetical protein [Thermoanaerobaculia bacterium]